MFSASAVCNVIEKSCECAWDRMFDIQQIVSLGVV
jgi:hypothetical protein